VITDKDRTDKERRNAKAKGEWDRDSIDEDIETEMVGVANLEKVVFKKLNVEDDEEEEAEEEYDNKSNSDMSGAGDMTGENNPTDEEGKSEMSDGNKGKRRNRRKKNEVEIECRVLVTCGHRDVNSDVFKSIHDNGLVYNGRLIVDKTFKTTDSSIFAAGSLCEFSNRYKALC
jgi:hypothetical protein